MFETTLPTRRKKHQDLTASLKNGLRDCHSFPNSVCIPFGMPCVDWLELQPFKSKVLWRDRDEPNLIAAAGQAACVTGGSTEDMDSVIRRCRAILNGNTNLKFYGGFSFRRDEYEQSDQWRPFGFSRFVLPRFVHDGRSLHCIVVDANDVENAERDIEALAINGKSEPRHDPVVVVRKDFPSENGWHSRIEDAIELFDKEIVEKVVLARRADFTFSHPLSPVRLVQQLIQATTACYHFCFQLDHGTAFLGATPERLIKRQGHRLLSEVVAGTRPRGETTETDDALAQQLLCSAKDQLEHDIVRKSIRQRLHKYVNALEVDSHASLLKLTRKQHLYSGVRATLKDDISDGELLERMHPTPAVGGYPTENAMAEIVRIEEFDRGWYAAPVGWVAADATEFVVAIRSGLICDSQLSLYSGAGIVPGSTAAEEWDEIENKIGDFLEVIAANVDSDETRQLDVFEPVD